MAATGRKKKPYRNDDIEKILPLKESISTLERAEKNLHDIDKKSLESGAKAVDDCYDMLQKLGGAVPGMAQLLADNKKLCAAFYRVGNEMNEFCYHLMSDSMLVARELIGCQSADEFYTLQRMATNQLSKRYIKEISRLGCMAIGDVEEELCLLPPD